MLNWVCLFVEPEFKLAAADTGSSAKGGQQQMSHALQQKEAFEVCVQERAPKRYIMKEKGSAPLLTFETHLVFFSHWTSALSLRTLWLICCPERMLKTLNCNTLICL